MAFGFKPKEKDKDKVITRRPATATPTPTPSSSSSTPPPTMKPTKSSDRPSTSSGFFSSLHKGKSIKKKRSLASLLETASSASGVSSGPNPSASLISRRTRSSDAASTLSAIPTVTSKDKEKHPANDDSAVLAQRVEDYRRLVPFKPSRTPQYTRWAIRNKMKVHTDYRAPYMQSYGRVMLESDRQFDLLLRCLNPLDSPTFHDFGNQDMVRVLDMGCGAGHWLLAASRRWKYAMLTGIDLVNILTPEAQECGRINLVQGNFLCFPWPVPSGVYDLVRMANLSLCIPYDKWEAVLGEVHRVLRVGGRLELIDDEIFFPYATEPPSRPTSLSSLAAPIPKLPPVRSLLKGESIFDDDEMTHAPVTPVQDRDDEDGDRDSVTTDSTLVSDADTSLRSRRQSSTSTAATSSSDAHSNAAQLDVPTPPADLPTTPTSVATIKPPEALSSPPQSEWSIDAAACRDMEAVYRNMLVKFGIHRKPRKFVADVMQHVFGNAEKVKSYHLKLAPKDAHKEFRSRSENEIVGLGILEEKEKDKGAGEAKNESQWRPWFGGDSEKDKEKKRWMKSSKSASPADFDNISSDVLDIRLPEGLSNKAALRLGIAGDIPASVSRVPENVSAKAAHRLGILMSSDRAFEVPTRFSTSPHDILGDFEDDDFDDPTPSTSPVPAPAAPSTFIDAVESVNQDSSAPALENIDKRLSTISMSSSPGDSKLSAKAAHRLGISYSALSEATASAKASTRRPLSSSSTLVSNPLAPVQSPGLIVSPDKFIPMSPSELEMHALKNVHMLIGCKPALAAYVACFVDKDGKRIEGDEAFDGALWEYECFRRRRFNWPDLSPGSWDDNDIDATDFVATTPTFQHGAQADAPVRSTTLRNSLVFDTSSLPPTIPLDSKTRKPYKSSKLTHVRTIRVYESVKTDEYTMSTMSNPRSPAPSPPISASSS
ncbi:hypothetical protein H0H92_004471 [Tricholoma furcatifolium]|nr:hypothetical protein H0H92_004471 [Tricholoma furcatifolium]